MFCVLKVHDVNGPSQAPEVIRHEKYGPKADVFSWAILAAEVLAQATPYHEHFLTPVQTALAVAGPTCLRPTLRCAGGTMPPSLQKIIVQAWAAKPEDRPTFREITGTLDVLSAALSSAEPAPSLFSRVVSYVGGYSSP